MENFDVNTQPNLTGMRAQVGQNGQPMQGVEDMPKQLQEQIQDSYVGNRASQLSEINPALQMAVAAPIMVGLGYGMDKFAQKCRGNYEDTIEYKLTNAGDKITNSFNNSRLGKANWFKNLRSKISEYKSQIHKKIYDNSAIYRSLNDGITSPELDMVKGQANGMKGIQLFDYPQVQNGFLESVQFPEDLDCYGADKKFIEEVRTKYDAASGQSGFWEKLKTKLNPGKSASISEAQLNVIQEAEFQLLSKPGNGKYCFGGIDSLEKFQAITNPADKFKVLQNMKAKASGYKSLKHWKHIEENIQEKMPDVLKALNEADNSMYCRRYTHGTGNWWHRFKGFVRGRNVYMSEYRNKLVAELGNWEKDAKLAQVMKDTNLATHAPKSALGKAFGKYGNIILEGATNRVAGGKLVAIIQAWFLAEAVIRTAQAKKGDKVATFAERLTELVAFFACMPFAIKALYKIGDLQNIGMTKDEVKQYKNMVNEHNAKAKAAEFESKDAWKKSYQDLKDFRKKAYKKGSAGLPKGKNIFTRIARKIGQITTIGLGQIRPYSKHAIEKIEFTPKGIGNLFKNVFRNPKFYAKEFGGSAFRFIFCMATLMPLIGNTVVKGCHKIFGKPEHSVLDEGKEEEPKQGELTPEQQARLIEMQKAFQQQAQQQQNGGNMLDKYRTPAQQPQATQAQQGFQSQEPANTKTYSYLPSPTPVKAGDIEPARGYMPSPQGVQTNSYDTKPGDDALARSEAAIQETMKVLNS